MRSPPIEAAGRLAATLAVLALPAACDRQGAPAGLPAGALDPAIAAAIGDPDTCVLLADPNGGKVLYRYGAPFNCIRGLPACDRPGFMSATQALALAGAPGGRGASCPSNADASRMVGWTEGRATVAGRAVIYSAVMEGERALPGHEMSSRLDGVFQRLAR